MGIRAASNFGALLATIAVGILLAACSQQRAELGAAGQKRAPRPVYKVGPPYQIGGVWYYPAVDYNYDETGLASWYGEAFDQQYTANGETFDLNQLTAAHRTLPMPSIVQVTNLENGRSIRLRVNDRGPFARDRILDVSRRASQLLGFENNGTTHVRVTIVKDESIRVAELAKRNDDDAKVLVAEVPGVAAVAGVKRAKLSAPQVPVMPPMNAARSPVLGTASPTLPAKVQLAPDKASGRIFVQAGAFSVRENAQRLQSRIAPLGSAEVTAASIHGADLYRVRLGPIPNVEQADQLLARVIGSGCPGARIVIN